MPSKNGPLVNQARLVSSKVAPKTHTEEVLKIKADRVCHGVKYLNRWPQNYDSSKQDNS